MWNSFHALMLGRAVVQLDQVMRVTASGAPPLGRPVDTREETYETVSMECAANHSAAG